MKVKVTKEKLYPVFKKFMEIYFKKYEWRKDIDEDIWFMGPDGYGHLGLVENKNLLWIYRDIKDKILRFLPMEVSMLQSLMGRWVGETFQIEGLNTSCRGNFYRYGVGETFPL
jgi:hypothetical protein